MNNWNIAGTVGKDAALRHTQAGDAVLGFSVAVKERVKGEDQTLWVDCSLFGKRADALSQYITKGTRIAVSGQAGVRQHEGKAYMTLRAADLTLLSSQSKPDHERQQTAKVARESAQSKQQEDFPEDDIPF
jgi:single-strand DNA-binding protein